jgi:uncharacterized protein YidB (DUF937 family)
MSRWSPPMNALLALLAVADFQQRGEVGEKVRLGKDASAVADGAVLSSALNELVDRFRQSGQGEIAQSWVSKGPNMPVTTSQLEQAIGPELVDTLSGQTGVSREQFLARLSRELPTAVDRCTTLGRLPIEVDFPQSNL